MFYSERPHWTVARANLCSNKYRVAAGHRVLWERAHEITFSPKWKLLRPEKCCAVQFLSVVTQTFLKY